MLSLLLPLALERVAASVAEVVQVAPVPLSLLPRTVALSQLRWGGGIFAAGSAFAAADGTAATGGGTFAIAGGTLAAAGGGGTFATGAGVAAGVVFASLALAFGFA